MLPFYIPFYIFVRGLIAFISISLLLLFESIETNFQVVCSIARFSCFRWRSSRSFFYTDSPPAVSSSRTPEADNVPYFKSAIQAVRFDRKEARSCPLVQQTIDRGKG